MYSCRIGTQNGWQRSKEETGVNVVCGLLYYTSTPLSLCLSAFPYSGFLLGLTCKHIWKGRGLVTGAACVTSPNSPFPVSL